MAFLVVLWEGVGGGQDGDAAGFRRVEARDAAAKNPTMHRIDLTTKNGPHQNVHSVQAEEP